MNEHVEWDEEEEVYHFTCPDCGSEFEAESAVTVAQVANRGCGGHE